MSSKLNERVRTTTDTMGRLSDKILRGVLINFGTQIGIRQAMAPVNGYTVSIKRCIPLR